MNHKNILSLILCLLSLGLISCNDHPINYPHHTESPQQIVLYASFSGPPKTLDPAKSYTTDESIFTAQIYEPPLQYHYLKRPYSLIPLTASEMPTVTYVDKNGKELPPHVPDSKVAFTIYNIKIKPGIQYQPHPAFARSSNGDWRYHAISDAEAEDIFELNQFAHHGTRELVAADYVYQIKRLAHPGLNSPILSLMENYILGLTDLHDTLSTAIKESGGEAFLDLRQFPLKGAKVIDRYHYQIIIKGKYPQFIYWLAMPFFSPIPWEADKFYSQKKLIEHNINFDWQPVGTGPYLLSENNPNLHMVLEKNPNFHNEKYPEGNQYAGKTLPFIDKIIFSLEKESIPSWYKFLQGYYDQSTISSENFSQAIQLDKNGEPQLTPAFKEKSIKFATAIQAAIFYLGFNMRDPIVGGNSEKARKLRLAIAIALDTEEWINLFLNGRGISAQGPLPPEIFGFLEGQAGINPYIYNWKDNRIQRKALTEAKKLLVEAGYANGINSTTGKPLVLNYDVAFSGGPDEAAQFDWMRKQFAKLGIQLNIRSTDFNRFQQKLATGNVQLFFLGWQADYPDHENFFFLLYGPNSKIKYSGENATNYYNPEFDKLFEEMRTLPNNNERQTIINQMLEIVRFDSPWIFMVNPKSFVLGHSWMGDYLPHGIANNTLKYKMLNPKMREEKQREWNKTIWWPLIAFFIFIVFLLLPIFYIKYFRQRRP